MLAFPYQSEPLTGPAPPSLPSGSTVRWRPLVPVRVLGASGRSRFFPRAVFDPCADDTVLEMGLVTVLGISLRPVFRGRGLGTDVVRVLTRYGFAIRGLHRLQIETLADNKAMLAAANGVGYRREGLLRASAWVNGTFDDEVILGLLADEWRDSPP